MKIISKTQEIEYYNNLKLLQDENIELKTRYKEQSKFYDNLLNKVYDNLCELKNDLKSNIKKEKIKIKIQDLLIEIGGKR